MPLQLVQRGLSHRGALVLYGQSRILEWTSFMGCIRVLALKMRQTGSVNHIEHLQYAMIRAWTKRGNT